MASDGPHANNLHLTPDQKPHQHLITQLFTGRMLFLHPTNSVKALKDYLRQFKSTDLCMTFAFSALMLLVGRQEGQPACKKTEWWGAGVVICLE